MKRREKAVLKVTRGDGGRVIVEAFCEVTKEQKLHIEVKEDDDRPPIGVIVDVFNAADNELAMTEIFAYEDFGKVEDVA
ncbi:MAG: hypothetical protein KKA28_18730 [Planctomycetes bacterium]|nr:hypothetical protein [Planctomycetota bacterium]